MRGRRFGGCGIAAVCAAGAIAAGAEVDAPAAEGPALAALLDAAGIERHLVEWPEANTLARERARSSLEPDAFALLSREVAAAFGERALRARVAQLLGAQVAEETSASLRAGYARTHTAGLLGPKGGLTAADLREFPRFASAVSRRQLDPVRLELIARVDAATGFGRDAWRVTGAWGGAIEHGARALRCEGRVAWEAPLSPEQSAERRQLAEPFRERVHLELLFLVRSRASPDLRRCVEFLETATARAFHSAAGDAVTAALAGALADLRTRLADPVAQRCGDRAAQPLPDPRPE